MWAAVHRHPHRHQRQRRANARPVMIDGSLDSCEGVHRVSCRVRHLLAFQRAFQRAAAHLKHLCVSAHVSWPGWCDIRRTHGIAPGPGPGPPLSRMSGSCWSSDAPGPLRRVRSAWPLTVAVADIRLAAGTGTGGTVASRVARSGWRCPIHAFCASPSSVSRALGSWSSVVVQVVLHPHDGQQQVHVVIDPQRPALAGP